MTNSKPTAELTRRAVIAAVPVAAALPALASTDPSSAIPMHGVHGAGEATTSAERARMIAVIEALESWHPWEDSGDVAAKAYAAAQMRRALGLAVPESTEAHAARHHEFQGEALARRQWAEWFPALIGQHF